MKYIFPRCFVIFKAKVFFSLLEEAFRFDHSKSTFFYIDLLFQKFFLLNKQTNYVLTSNKKIFNSSIRNFWSPLKPKQVWQNRFLANHKKLPLQIKCKYIFFFSVWFLDNKIGLQQRKFFRSFFLLVLIFFFGSLILSSRSWTTLGTTKPIVYMFVQKWRNTLRYTILGHLLNTFTFQSIKQ